MYRHCILDYMDVKQKALCGKFIKEPWCFVSIQHWFMHNPKNNRVLGCVDCLSVLENKIIEQKEQ